MTKVHIKEQDTVVLINFPVYPQFQLEKIPQTMKAYPDIKDYMLTIGQKMFQYDPTTNLLYADFNDDKCIGELIERDRKKLEKNPNHKKSDEEFYLRYKYRITRGEEGIEKAKSFNDELQKATNIL